MRPGNSCNTSRQSPISLLRTDRSGFSRGRQTRWTEDASAAEFCARSLVPISVSMGQEAVITQSEVINAANIASHPDVSLLAKTKTLTPEGLVILRLSAQAFVI